MSAAAVPATPTPSGYRLRDEVVIPPGAARAVRLRAGEIVQLVDVRGKQVSDVMIWRLDAPDEYLSPSHTVSCNRGINLKPGDSLYSNRRRPLVRVRRDTVGYHDLIVPCCDPERYRRDYGIEHGSCLAAIQEGLELAGESWQPRAELAWNCFMHETIGPDGSVTPEASQHGAGAHVELDVLDDVGFVASSCPQDLTPINDHNITEIALRVYEPG
jgi:uncharacterized protein YcgI (DUF1989 family)